MSTVSGAALFLGNTDINGSSATARTPHTMLDQQDFLKLLVTKMSAQDPMNPQGDQEFIAQMAQFTSLEQSKTMSNDIAALTASGLIGRNVVVKGQNTVNGVENDVKGTVSSISFNNGSPEVIVGGKNYALNRVSLITPGDLDPTVMSVAAPGGTATSNNPVLGLLPVVA